MKRIFAVLSLFTVALGVKAQPVNYHQNIQPLIQSHCLPCHAKNSIAPIPLTDYEELLAYGNMLGYVTANNIMPPWRAENKEGHLKNYNTLNEKEITLIKKWIASGFPEGDRVQRPATTQYHTNVSGRLINVAMQKAFPIKSDYTERAQVFVLEPPTKKDEWIYAIKFLPGNRKIVKLASISLDTGIQGKLYDSYDERYGYSSQVGLSYIPSQFNWFQWTPDMADSFFNLPAPIKMKAGSRLLMHIAYAASDSIQKDSSVVLLRAGEKIPDSSGLQAGILIDTTHITNGPFVINKGDKKKVFAVRKLEQDEIIVSLMPMGQFALSSWDIYAIDSSNGIRIPLLRIPHWDAHWKKKYYLQQPLHLPKGSTIHATAYYNNSDDNRSLIILPPKQIRYGEGIRDEMFVIQYDYLESASRVVKK